MTNCETEEKPHIALACLIAIAIAMHAPILELQPWDTITYATCLIIALALRLRWAIHTALLIGLITVIMMTPVLRDSIGRTPVLPLLIPLIVSSLVVAVWTSTRQTFTWMRVGHVSVKMWALVGLTGFVSAGALMTWAVWTDNLGIGERMMADLSHIPFSLLMLLGIPLFAFLNAVTEEVIFRGILFTALMESSKSWQLATIVQATAFAALHYEMGFPNGPIGYGMVFGYALVLGYLRLRTNGLLAPITAHIVADLVIGFIMAGQTRI